MRVKRVRFLSPTSMKLAATSRYHQRAEFAFLGNESDLLNLMDKEITLYLADRRKRPYNHEGQSIFLPAR